MSRPNALSHPAGSDAVHERRLSRRRRPHDRRREEEALALVPGLVAEATGGQAEAIRGLQRVHGNFAVQRLLTSNQLIHGTGMKPHGDVKLLGRGPTLKSQSTHYKAVLDALDAYHRFLDTTAVAVGTAGTQAGRLESLLNEVRARCQAYLGRKQKPAAKMQTWLNDLVNDVAAEKRAVWSVAANPPGGQTWRQAVGGFGESGGLVVGPTANVEVTNDPGLETTFTKATAIFSDPAMTTKGGAAAKGDLAVRHETTNPKVVFIEKYTLEKPEKGGDPKPKFQSDGKGFVASGALKASKFKHEAQAADVPLFTRKPNIEDVNQQAIGDCYLMAALGSIVEKSPEYIYGMMRDDRGTPPAVTVRLFDITQSPPQVRFLQVQKSVISHDRRSSGALWVPLLEKAYAVLGVVYDKEKTVAAKGSSSYLQLGAGGFSDVAFGVLTGKADFLRHDIKDDGGMATDDDPEFNFSSIKPWSRGETLKHKVAKFEQMESYKFFVAKTKPDRNRAKDLTDRWIAFLTPEMVEALTNVKRIEAIEDLFTKGRLDQEVRDLLLPEVAKMYPGKRGTGRYTESQLQIFKTIADALAADRYVALGSQETVAKKSEGKGKSAGEDVAKGLVGSHAYSVLSVRTDPATGRKFARVRNPWGDDPGGYGRVYKEKGGGVLGVETDKEELKAKQRAAFDLELTDLTKRFSKIYVGG